MANVINTGGGSAVTMLASLTSVPTSSTAVSGTEPWKKYDAIYFECFMHFITESDKEIFTNLILTNNVSIGSKYQPVRVTGSSGNSAEINLYCMFSENAISMYKEVSKYEITKVNIYGVNF